MKRIFILATCLLLLSSVAHAQPSQGSAVKITDGNQTLDITVGSAAKVDGSAVVQPMSATSLPLPAGAATAAHQVTQNGYLDGVEGLLTSGNASTASIAGKDFATQTTLSTLNAKIPSSPATDRTLATAPFACRLTDGTSFYTASGGGGGGSATEYTEGDTDSTFTGGMTLMEGAANTAVPLQGTALDGLLVDLGANNDVSVSGSVTCNAGTNLNTSLLATDAHVDGLETLVGSTNTALTTLNAKDFATQTTLAAIDTKTPALGQALAASSVPVVLTSSQITTLTPPAAITGFATAANQTTIIGHVDGLEALLTTIDADTSKIPTSPATDRTTAAAPFAVRLSDGASFYDATSGGGSGTEYTEGDTDSSITGTACLMEGASSTLLPIQGTVTDGLLVNLGANNDVTVSGVSTAANQTTIIGHVDGVETLLTAIDGHVDGVEGVLGTIDADTGNIATSVASIDTKTPALGQALAAASVPVVLTAAQITTLTPPAAITGFATAANQTTIIGHVDGLETLIGTTNTNLTTIDGHVDGIEGSVDGIEALIGTTNTNLTTIDGHVDGLEGTATSSLTALQLIDDSIFADDAAFTPATSKVNVAGFEFDDASPDSVDEGDAGAARMSANRNVYTQIRDAAGNERGANVNASNQLATTADTELPTAAALTDDVSLPTTSIIGSPQYVYDATNLDLARSVINGMNTTGTGVQSAGILGQLDDTSTGTVTENQFAPLRLSTRRALLVEGVASGTAQPVTVSSTTSITPGSAAANLGKAEDAAHASSDVGVMMLGVRAATPTERSAGPTDGDYEPLGINAQGAAWVTTTPSTTGGWDSSLQAALSTTVQTVKGSAGNFGGYFCFNPNASVAYVQIFDTSGAVTLGTTVPILSFGIPSGSSGNLEISNGAKFSNAIKVATTTTVNGSSANGTALDCNFFYK